MNLLLALLACSQPEPPPVDVRPLAPAPQAEDVPPPAVPGAAAPALVTDSTGVLAAWVEPAFEGAHRVVAARWTLGGWSEPEVVAAGPQVLPGGADGPDIVRGADGVPVVSWLQGDPAEPGATQVALSRMGRQGWRSLGPAHRDGVAAEHGFAALSLTSRGTRVTWLDGRGVPEGGPTQLRTAPVGQAVGAEAVLDPVVCDCCRVDAVGDLVAYRDLRESPEGRVRDISVRRDGLVAHLDDGWVIEGCPVDGPAIDADGDLVAVAWYTEATGPTVKLAFSHDGGHSFAAPVRVDAGSPQGQVDLALVAGQAVVAWSEHGNLHLRRVESSGALHADVDAGPLAGTPALAAAGDGLLVAWQQPGEPATLAARHVPLAALPDEGAVALQTAERGEQLGAPFPHAYVAADLDGQPVAFSQWAGQPVLVNLWATWCPPCMAELPALAELHTTWGPRGLVMLGIAVEDQTAKVRATAKARNMTWTLLQATSRSAGETFASNMLPTTLVYGGDGTLLYQHTGAITAEDADLLAALERAVGG